MQNPSHTSANGVKVVSALRAPWVQGVALMASEAAGALTSGPGFKDLGYP